MSQHQRLRRKTSSTSSEETPLQHTVSPHSVLQMQRLIGNRATRNLLQRAGSLTVVSGSDKTETADDSDSLTKRASQKYGSLLKRFQQLTKATLGNQHPGFAQLGILPGTLRGNKKAVVVGNSQYSPPISQLAGAKRDAHKAHAIAKRQKYDSQQLDDLDKSGLQQTYTESAQNANEGDSLFLYYAGHGIPQGILGVDAGYTPDKGGKRRLTQGILNYTDFIPQLEAAAGKGANIAFVIDACYSGTATDLVRKHVYEKLGRSTNPRVQALQSQIDRLEDLKKLKPEDLQKAAGAGRGLELDAPATTGGRDLVLDTDPDDEVNPATQLWQNVIYPELQQVSHYLKSEGIVISFAPWLSSYKPAAIEQQINIAINALTQLAQTIEQEDQESMVANVPSPGG